MIARLFGMAFAVWALGAAVVAGIFFGGIGVLPFWPIPRGRREKYTMRAASAWARFVVRWIVFADVEVRSCIAE